MSKKKHEIPTETVGAPLDTAPEAALAPEAAAAVEAAPATDRAHVAPDQAADEPPKALADTARATATTWAVRGLGGVQRGLVTTARWLDDRAKRAGALAGKLSGEPAPAGQPTEHQV